MSNFDLITHYIIKTNNPGGGIEDFAEMYRRSPVFNAYWEDKRANISKIQVPVFISGSDFSSIHTMGSVRWLALQFGDREAINDNAFADFPIPGTDYRDFFLSQDGLKEQAATADAVVSYDSTSTTSIAEFSYTFPQRSRLSGLPKAVLYTSCKDQNDMNTYIILRKRDKNSKLLFHLCFPFAAVPTGIKSIDKIPEKDRQSLNLHPGSFGVLRASHRRFIPEKSIHPQFPFHPHEIEEKIEPGEVVKLEIVIWSMGVDFDEGETISMQVGGSFPGIAEYSAFSKTLPEEEKNKGEHRIHIGPSTPSKIILPFVPL
ncbi:hypothetical protein PMIN03_002448 [Paraphaeosphaeria minitans]